MIPSPALLHAAWITAAVAVCLTLCTIYSRKSSSSVRRGSSRSREANSGCIAVAATAAAAAKVSPTPSPVDTAKSCCVNIGDLHDLARVGDDVVVQDGPVTVIEVGTHGPIAPVFPVPDPMPPRQSLSVKNIRIERLVERIRSRRWGAGDDDQEEEAGQPDDTTLWNKTILLGERCRVPSGDEAMGGTWKSYRPRQPRSVPVTRSNSFAGVLDSHGGSCRPAGATRL